ncbi:hypothetical protein VKT23_000186 [Stygiomarasmius scandens]|uniref:G domain-containing protein n=1 Tax=Marasmiellus scandens TaxID=2682957 RepID=A0ABR1K4M3_9AGAR
MGTSKAKAVNAQQQGGKQTGKTGNKDKKANNVPKQTPRPSVPSVIIFGEPGVGKTSLFNMITTQDSASRSLDSTNNRRSTTSTQPVSAPSHVSATIPSGGSNTPHQVTIEINGLSWDVIDTPGLTPKSVKNSPAQKKVRERARTGAPVLVFFCIRGRLKETTSQVYKKLRASCKGNGITWCVVIVGLENETSMESWWDANKHVFKGYRMEFDDHACITAVIGKRGVFKSEYEQSKKKIKELIDKYRNGKKTLNQPNSKPKKSFWSMFCMG